MYSLEKIATVPSKGRGREGGAPEKLEKNPRFHKVFMQFGDELNLKFRVMKRLEGFTCLVYGQNRESSMCGLRVKFLHKIVGEDDKFTFKSKVDHARLLPCHSALKPHLQWVNHRVALYKRADDSILEKPNPYDDGQGWIRSVGTGVVLRCCVTKLTSRSPGPVKWKTRRRKTTRKDEFDVDDFS